MLKLEQWLVNIYIGEYQKILTPSEIKREIKHNLNKAIENILEQTEQKGPCIILEELYYPCKILDTRPLENKILSRYGILTPVKGGFLMFINPRLDVIEKRYTIAHELGHTFLYDKTEEIPRRPYEKFIFSKDSLLAEDYANDIARMILIPKRSIIQVIKDNKSLELKKLCRIYNVSQKVMKIRLINDLALCTKDDLKLNKNFHFSDQNKFNF